MCQIENEKRNNPDQQAVIELAKESKKRGGITIGDANIILKFADEYDVPAHGSEIIQIGWDRLARLCISI